MGSRRFAGCLCVWRAIHTMRSRNLFHAAGPASRHTTDDSSNESTILVGGAVVSNGHDGGVDIHGSHALLASSADYVRVPRHRLPQRTTLYPQWATGTSLLSRGYQRARRCWSRDGVPTPEPDSCWIGQSRRRANIPAATSF